MTMQETPVQFLAQSAGLGPAQLSRLMRASPKTASRLLHGDTVKSGTLLRFVAATKPPDEVWKEFKALILTRNRNARNYLDERQMEFQFQETPIGADVGPRQS